MSQSGRRRRDTVFIYTDDYPARIRHLEARIKAVEEANSGPRRLGQAPEHAELVEERKQLIEEMEAKATKVDVQAPRRSAWKALIPKHPPRKPDEATEEQVEVDKFFGFNIDTCAEHIIKLGVLSVEEAGSDVRQWSSYSEPEMDDFLDDLGEGDFNALWQRITALYRGVAQAPKADLASPTTTPSDETSS